MYYSPWYICQVSPAISQYSFKLLGGERKVGVIYICKCLVQRHNTMTMARLEPSTTGIRWILSLTH